MKTTIAIATLAATMLGSAGMASADSIPGMRGHD
ncbi:glyoxalase, partial [Mesorhizobium sp. M7A.F.Ca.CA.004.02.1.1]